MIHGFGVINGVMFGLFGLVAYVFPILLFFGMAFFLANRGSRALTGKMIYLFGMLFMLTNESISFSLNKLN